MSPRKREEVFTAFERWGFDQRGWLPGTRLAYVRKVRSADRWLEANRGVSVIWAKPKDLQAFLFDSAPTAANRNHIRAALIAFGEFLVDQQWIEINPALALPRLPRQRTTPKALEVAECRRIAAMARTLEVRDRTLVYVYLYGGLRRDEGRLLEWDHVSAAGDWLRFPGKGGKVREVPMHPEAASSLIELRAQGLDPRWCFPSPIHIGKPASANYVFHMVRDLGASVGLPRLHPHALRHSVATRLLEQGADIREVQEWLGHAALTSTQIYTRVRPRNLREAAAKLDFWAS